MGLHPATVADEPFLRALYATTRSDVAAMVGWPEAERSAFLDGQFHAQLAGYHDRFPASEHLIITLEQEPVGRLWVDRAAEEVRVIDIALLPAHRGCGIGRGCPDRRGFSVAAVRV